MDLTPTLTDVFDRGLTVEGDLPRDVEVDLIADAKAGSSDALVALIRQYAPVLRQHASRHRPHMDDDEARSTAAVAVLDACHVFDPATQDRLAAVIVRVLQSGLSAAASSHTPMSIPTRTLQRFYGILKRADGDVTVARTLAPAYKMSEETFNDVLSALRTVDPLVNDGDDPNGLANVSHARPIWTGSAPDAETSDLVALAFAAVDPLESEVISLAYGFTDYDPVPDAEIGFRLGVNRVTAWRYRTRGIVKMRAALAADTEEASAAA